MDQDGLPLPTLPDPRNWRPSTTYEITTTDGEVTTVLAVTFREHGNWLDFADDDGRIVLRLRASDVASVRKA